MTWSELASVLQREYTTFTTANHQTVHIRDSGQLCVLGVAKSHPQIQSPNEVTHVSFSSSTCSLLHTEPAGKKKIGACRVRPGDEIATVRTSDGGSFRIFACMAGAVIEINRRLVDEPGLLMRAAGYLCVLQPQGSRQYPANTTAVISSCAAFRSPDEIAQVQGKRTAGGAVAGCAPMSKKQAKKTCWEFSKGTCKLGAGCRFLHETAADQIAARAARKAAAAAAVAATDAVVPVALATAPIGAAATANVATTLAAAATVSTLGLSSSTSAAALPVERALALPTDPVTF
jgi:hypothetical protein